MVAGRSAGEAAQLLEATARQLFPWVGHLDPIEVLQSDLETLVFHVEARQRFLGDRRLAAAAASFWAEFATPFEQLAAVARLRAAFEARVAGLGDIGQVLKSHLFSANTKIVEKLRSYQPWVAQLQSDLAEWPEPCGQMALRQAAQSIEERAAQLGQLAEGIRELRLADVNTPSTWPIATSAL